MLLWFVRAWIAHKDKLDEAQRAEIDVIKQRLTHLDTKLHNQDESLKEGRESFKNIREDFEKYMRVNSCKERHEILSKEIERLEKICNK